MNKYMIKNRPCLLINFLYQFLGRKMASKKELQKNLRNYFRFQKLFGVFMAVAVNGVVFFIIISFFLIFCAWLLWLDFWRFCIELPIDFVWSYVMQLMWHRNCACMNWIWCILNLSYILGAYGKICLWYSFDAGHKVIRNHSLSISAFIYLINYILLLKLLQLPFLKLPLA